MVSIFINFHFWFIHPLNFSPILSQKQTNCFGERNKWKLKIFTFRTNFEFSDWPKYKSFHRMETFECWDYFNVKLSLEKGSKFLLFKASYDLSQFYPRFSILGPVSSLVLLGHLWSWDEVRHEGSDLHLQIFEWTVRQYLIPSAIVSQALPRKLMQNFGNGWKN
jgi:hypothetical protein